MTDTITADALPADYHRAWSMLREAGRDYSAPHVDAVRQLNAEQRKRYNARNMMTPDRVSMLRVGGFIVEIATGMFLDSRLIGVTAFRIGGDRADDWNLELSGCVYSIDAMRDQLAKIAEA